MYFTIKFYVSSESENEKFMDVALACYKGGGRLKHLTLIEFQRIVLSTGKLI
jgi:hypothetical protein